MGDIIHIYAFIVGLSSAVQPGPSGKKAIIEIPVASILHKLIARPAAVQEFPSTVSLCEPPPTAPSPGEGVTQEPVCVR